MIFQKRKRKATIFFVDERLRKQFDRVEQEAPPRWPTPVEIAGGFTVGLAIVTLCMLIILLVEKM